MGDGINRFYRSMLAGCRSMLGAPRIPDFKIPNSEFCMAYGPVHKLWARIINGGVGHAMSYG